MTNRGDKRTNEHISSRWLEDSGENQRVTPHSLRCWMFRLTSLNTEGTKDVKKNSTTYSFNQSLWSTYCVPGTMLGDKIPGSTKGWERLCGLAWELESHSEAKGEAKSRLTQQFHELKAHGRICLHPVPRDRRA